MGREVRMVPENWQHPKDDKGHFIPLLARFPYDPEEIAEGLRDGWLTDEPPHYGCDVMPNWPDAERTHYQMYESTSEGTPISPVMPTPEALAGWLADNNASAFAGTGATYDQWLKTIKRGWAVSALISPRTGLVSGVEGQAIIEG